MLQLQGGKPSDPLCYVIFPHLKNLVWCPWKVKCHKFTPLNSGGDFKYGAGAQVGFSVTLAFPHTAEVCLDHFSLETIMTPRYFMGWTIVKLVWCCEWSSEKEVNFVADSRDLAFSRVELFYFSQVWRGWKIYSATTIWYDEVFLEDITMVLQSVNGMVQDLVCYCLQEDKWLFREIKSRWCC